MLTETNLTDHQRTVFLDRYAKKGPDGAPLETDPDQMWRRVASAIADDEIQAEDFYDILQGFKFVPGGRILSGAGVDSEVTFYNCYVIPVETKARRTLRSVTGPAFTITLPDDVTIEEVNELRDVARFSKPEDTGSDSREAIFDTIGLMVDIMSRGGGVGINWSVLRPKGTYLKRVNGTTSGPVSWMDVASKAVGVVEQGGTRRGAAMFMLDDWHPDLLEFIDAKRNFNAITNANVSVAVSDEFMDAVREGRDWVFEFPNTNDSRYNSEWDGDLAGWKERGGEVVVHGTVPARDVWRAIAKAAWASGEPGLVFLGRYNTLSTGRDVERIISVNPCGEQGLGPYSVCNLGAMNLDAYIIENKHYGEPSTFEFDWGVFANDVEVAVTFLDQVIDKNFYFIPENEKAQKSLRRIGLGVMGLADALIALQLRYGSREAVTFTERIFSTMKIAAIRRSCVLAQLEGAAPAWNKEMLNSPYLAPIRGTPLGSQVERYGLRNLFLLTQAPTGTTSILAGVNSGIEPYFEFSYTRVDRTGSHSVTAGAVTKYISEFAHKPSYAVTSSDVSIDEHIAMQAAAQTYIDSSVSKTINGPSHHTVEDVERAYSLAYDSGLKGIAYFRDGSGRDQVLYKEPPKAPEMDGLDDLPALLEYAVEFKRPKSLSGKTIRIDTRAGSAFVTVNRDDNGKPVEVFLNIGKAGSDLAGITEAIGRLASLALRHGASLGGVANQLEGVGGNGKMMKSVPNAIGLVLSEMNSREEMENLYLAQEAVVTELPPQVANRQTTRADLCPECHQTTLVYQEGCSKCLSCGYSAC